jgi:hypothetical protein
MYQKNIHKTRRRIHQNVQIRAGAAAVSQWSIVEILIHSVHWFVFKDSTYGGWKKSCTTLAGWNLNGIDHLISTGAGFLPSTVSCIPAKFSGIPGKMFKQFYGHMVRLHGSTGS